MFVYPTWWASMPAILKGWLDRVLLPDVAFSLNPESRKVEPGLTNIRRLVGITTYGAPRWQVALLGDGGRTIVGRTIRLMCRRPSRLTWLSLDRLDGRSEAERAEFIQRVEDPPGRRVMRGLHLRSRPGRTLVVVCHPRPDSLVRAAASRVECGLEQSGEEVRVIDLDADDFEPRLTRWEKQNHLGSPDDRPELGEYFDALRWATRIVFVYPTWYSGQPAQLKGWFDRVWANGVAFELPEGSSRIRGLLKNVRRLEIVTTHGSSRLVNLLQANSGQRVVFRSLRVLCHPLCRTRLTAIYDLDRAGPEEVEQWLDEVEERFRR